MPRKSKSSKMSFRNSKMPMRRKRKQRLSLIAKCQKSVSLPEMFRLFEVSEAFDMQGSGGVYSTFFVANGLFNPGATNWNAQPVGFNEYMALYSKYRVLKGSISMQIVNNSDTTVNGVWVVVYPSVVSTSLSGSVATATCQPKSCSVFIGNLQGVGLTTLRTTCSSHTAFGESPMLDENFSGDFGTNPSYKWYWIINAYSVGANDANLKVLIKIKFWTKLYARIPLLLDTPSLQLPSPFKGDTNMFIPKYVVANKQDIREFKSN